MILGIDLGTTKSIVDIWKNGRPFMIPNENGRISIPSLILVTPSGEIYAGNEAANHPDRYTGNNVTVSSVKKLIGRQGETEWDWWTAHPQVVYALILAEVKKHAEAYLGEEIH